jgi:L-methionine (R)-S-oxide reductase
MGNLNNIRKKQLYAELISQFKSLIDGVDNNVGALAHPNPDQR